MTKSAKTYFYIVVACSLIGLGGVVFWSRTGVAQRLDAWQVTPRPEQVTELYFTDYRQLPVSLTSGASQKLAFTMRNLEHQTTTYRYKIVASLLGGAQEKLLGSGTRTLGYKQSAVTNQTITIPALGPRIMVKVVVDYMGVVLGDRAPSLQTQSIDYLLTVVTPSLHGGKGKA